MEFTHSILIRLALSIILCSSVFCVSSYETYDYFHIIHQWPMSLCNTKEGCCSSGEKPAANFTIQEYQPVKDSRVQMECPGRSFNSSKISDLTGILHSKWPTIGCPGSQDAAITWAEQWGVYGVCTKFDQHEYFQSAIDVNHNLDLITALNITDNWVHTYDEIFDMIIDGTGYQGWLECNLDSDGNRQLRRIYHCVDRIGRSLIDCPGTMPYIPIFCKGKDLVRIPTVF